MEQINSNNIELNGLSKNKLYNNLLKKELPINITENNIDEVNDKLFEEEKNKINLPIPYFEHNLRNIAHNFIPINSLSDKVSEENINANLKQKRNISDETLENGLNLDEQNLKEYYDNIENEINKLKKGKSKILEENKNIALNNSSNKSSLKMNSQFENDLFYYSDEEDKDINKKVEEKKQNINKDTKSNISQEKINNINNNKDKEDKDKKDKKDINIKINEKNKDKKINLKESLTQISDFDKKLLEKVEYGIDESGNPFSIKDNKEEDNEIINNKKEIKKAVAYIIQQKEKGKNYLIDTKGKLIPKMDDGYYNYKKDNIRLLIKDFDVQHPELRVFGARRNDDFLFQDEKKDEGEHDIKNDDYIHKSIEIKKSEEQNKPKDKIVINRNVNLNLFKKNNISVENFEKYKVKKLVINKNLLNMKNSSPIAIKKNIIHRNNGHINIWKIKENPKTDDREKCIYDKKTNKIFYKKLNPKSLNNINNTTSNNNASFNEYEKFENSDTIRRTNNILNKSVRGLYTYRNYTNINNSGIESNSKKMNLNKSDYSKNIINKPLYTEETKNNNNNTAQEIRNVTCTTSRISLYKYKRNTKRTGSFSSNYYNRLFNLKSLLNPNKDNINNINNNDNKDNNIYKKENPNQNDYKIKKSKSSKYIISTIDKISNSIKYIKNRIENNLMKLNTENDIYNNANNNLNEKIKNSKPLSTISTNSNSQINISKQILPFNNYYSNNKLLLLNYRNNLNIPNDLNQKMNASLKENKKFQCSILCKEVNDIISNYTIKNNENKNVTKINTIYDYDSEIKTNDNKINSFLNKTKNKSNFNFAKNFTQRYNYITEQNKNNEENKAKEELYKKKILSFENSFKIKNNNSVKYLNTFNNSLKAKNMKSNIKINTKSNSIGCLKDINNNLNNDKSKFINKNIYNYYYNNTFKPIRNNINDSNLNYCVVMNNYNRNYNYTERNKYTNQNI